MNGEERGVEIERDVIIETICAVMVPLIQLFGLYVLIHGALGPGGGFQAGCILGSSFVLYIVAFGITGGRKRMPEVWNTFLSDLGVYIYAGTGLITIGLSLGIAEFLNYGWYLLPVSFEERRALGMDTVELGIGITVMATMTNLFFDLAWKEGAGREERKEVEERK